MALTLSVEEIVEQSKNPLLGIAPKWGRVRLGDIATIQNGAPFKSKLFNTDGKGMPVIRIRDVGSDGTNTFYSGEYDPAYVVRYGDLLIGMDGDFTCARWRGTDALLNQRVCRIIPKNGKYEPRLMDFALPGYLKAINDVTSSVTVKHLSSRTVAEIPLPLPPIPEQRRIVEAIERQLGRLDAAVSRLQAAKAKLKRYKQAVLKAAVEGELTSDWREKQKQLANAQALLNELLAQRKRTAVKSKDKEATEPGDDLPELTEGWVWASLEQIGQPNRPIIYGIIKPGPHIEEGVPYVRVTEMKDGTIDVDSLQKASKERAAKFARATLTAGDVLISKDGTIGRVAVVPPELEGGNITQHVMRAPLSRLVNRDYVVWAIRSDQCQHWLTGETRGVALRGVNVEDFRRLPIPLPPLAEQAAIVAQVEDRMERTAQLEATLDAQLLQATRLRQAVLKRAFEGKLVQPEKAVTEVGHAQARQRRHFHRAVLSAEIVHQLHAEPTFGRVKHQKIFHLIEHIAGLDEIDGQYHREAAGPLDNKLIYANAKEMKKQRWYEEVKRSGQGFEYKALEKAGGHSTYYERYWGDKASVIQGIIRRLQRADSERCEIVSTVYAAWNDLLIWGKEPTQDAILDEVLNHWNESKRKISEDRWRAAIQWIKEQGWEPTGFGKPTRQLS